MKTHDFTRRFCGPLFFAISLVLITAISARADYKSTVLADNPLAYYALNPAVDGTSTAPDLSGNGNDGIAAGITAASGPSAYITNAANFNGSAAIDLSYGSNPGLLNFNGPITLEAWCQPSSSGLFADIFARGYDNNSPYNEIAVGINGPYGANYWGQVVDLNISGGTQTTNWTYVVLSSDGTNDSLYVNGILVAQNPDTSGSTTNFPDNDDWVIGNGSDAGSGRLFNGNISEVALYNHGLTAAQVLNHYYIGELNSPASNSVPLIVTQPQSQQGYIGGSVTFSVTAVSASPMTNQWSKGATPLAGQTNSTLTFTNLQSTNAGSYSVVIGNINGTTNSISVTLSVSATNSLKWSSAANSGVWDNGISTNWINVNNSQAVVFNSGDSVLFDDTVGVPTTVTVSNTVAPNTITVNASNNAYSMGGPGTISGSGGLVKQGSSTLTITSAGNFTGPVTISGGAVYAGNNCFDSVASIAITNNSTLDLGGGQISSNKPVTVSGFGLNGEGAIYNSYDNYPKESLNITLAGDTKFGGANRWDLDTGSQISGPHNLTIDWSSNADNHYGQWNSVTIGANVASITLTNAADPTSVTNGLGLTGMDAAFQNPGTVLTVSTNCQLVFYSGGFNGSLHLLNGAQIYHYTAPAGFYGNSIAFENGATLISYYSSGATTPVNSAITLNGIAHFVIGDHNMVYTNVISGSGGFVEDYYNSQMVFSASNTYNGPTIIGSSGNSPEVALTGNGSISHSSLIFFGGSDLTVAHLDVIGRSDQTLTLAGGQTLGGIGDINGSLVVASGATLSPAGTNTTIGITTGANATGAIKASGAVKLNGTTVLKLDGSGVNDEVQAGGGITYGGTLELVNISGSPYAAGNSFQIFSGTSYSNSFASIVPATPGSGLAWDTSQLNIGFLNVVAASSQPVIGSTRASGGNLIFSGTGGSANGTYYVLTTTNLTNSLSNWTVVSTNSFDGSGNFSVTNAINPATPQRFYIIRTQ
jgi:autotransporter-associated beta strand protein